MTVQFTFAKESDEVVIDFKSQMDEEIEALNLIEFSNDDNDRRKSLHVPVLSKTCFPETLDLIQVWETEFKFVGISNLDSDSKLIRQREW